MIVLITLYHRALESFIDFSFEWPEGFRAPSLARKAIPQRGATITKNILKWICWWYSNIKFVLEVPQVVACIALKIKSLTDLPPIRVA